MKAKIENIAGLVWELNQVGSFDLEYGVSIRGVKLMSFCENRKPSFFHPGEGIIKGHNEMYFFQDSFISDLDQCISYLQGLLHENQKE